MRKFLSILLIALTAVAGFAAPIQAQDTAALQQRMKERVPQIDALKTQGTVGENNRGFLEARGQVDATGASLIAEENEDRRAVYVDIAKRTNTTPEIVGKGRAQQIAARSAPGVWLQKPDGSWYKK